MLCTVVAAYGSGENDTKENRNAFWKKVQEALDKRKGKSIIIAEDFNGRMRVKEEETIGVFGKRIENNNGSRIIEFCFMNNLVIGNSFFCVKAYIKLLDGWETEMRSQ